jgi:hypothetical protein
MRRRFSTTIAAVVLSAISVLGQQSAVTLQSALLERTVWGPDFGALLAQLPALRQTGETEVYVFADRAAGSSAYAAEIAARTALAKAPALAVRPANLRPQFSALQAPATAPLRVEVVQLPDGDGYHMALTRASLTLLAPGLTMQTVRAQLGPPSRTVLRTIHGQGERQPLILTLHYYAGDAIAFAESNLAEPGVVERAVLTLASVATVVAQ